MAIPGQKHSTNQLRKVFRAREEESHYGSAASLQFIVNVCLEIINPAEE